MRLPYSCRSIVTVICLLAATLAQAQTTQPAEKKVEPDWSPVVAPGSRIVWDVPYVEHGHALQRLDIFAPPNVTGAPVVLFVHGGEWAKRDKAEVAYKPKFFNDNGVVLVSVNYRLSGVALHPAQVDDLAAAIRWAREHVAEYGGDPDKLVLMGHSAGCHLVTLVTLDARPLAKVGLTPAAVRGVVSWSGGAFDLVQKVADGGMYAGYIRQNFGATEASWRNASPMAHVADRRPEPRFLFASAGDGKAASRAASEKMVELIRAAGGQADAVVLESRTHSTANFEVGRPGDETGKMLLEFIRDATK